MPSDAELRDRFREGTQPRGQIDVDAVLRRARARRRPKVLLAGAGSMLAIAAIAVPAALSTSLAGGAGGASTMADGGAAPEFQAGEQDTAIAPPVAQKLNLCGAPVAEPTPAASGLVITVAPLTADADDLDIPVTVTLTNAGTERITGTTGSRPSLTFARDGVTLWHTNGAEDLVARVVDLAPGQSMSYPATFAPVVCSDEDEMSEEFRQELAAAGPGTYTLSAVIDVTSDDGLTIELVSGPPVEVVLD